MTSLRQAFLLGDGGVISLVGAGGKTSLMFRLARELSASGDHVLTTTTTRIFEPEADQSSCVLVSDSVKDLLQEANGLIGEYRHVTMARDRLRRQGKLIGFAPQTIELLRNSHLFRWIIVEADGAAGRPLKAPAEHEPVVPVSTDFLLGVAGISAVGKPLTDQWVFRSDRFSEITGVTRGTAISEAAIADVFISAKGVFKDAPATATRLVFLNQADTPDKCAAGQRIASILTEDKRTGIKRVVVGQALADKPVWKTFDPIALNRR